RIFFMAPPEVRPLRPPIERSTDSDSGRISRCRLRTNAMTTLHEMLRELLSNKASELFADYGVPCTAIDIPPSGDPQLCGILGFTGDRLCGSVVLSATHDAVSSSNPIGDGATRGWVAELTNQLVGRFKNALLRHGLEVAMSIPVVLTATQLMPLPHTRV